MIAPISQSFLDYLRFERRDRPKTCASHNANLRILTEHLGNLLEVKTHRPIIEALNTLEQRRGWRNTTTKKFEKTLIHFYKWALREGLIEHNPFPLSVLRTTKCDPQPHYDRQIDRETIERILFHPNWTRREYCWIRVLFACGIRRQEAVDLEIQNVDLNRRYIRVKGKGDKWREVPFDEDTGQELEKYMKGLRANYTGPWLFPREDFKGPMTGSGLWKSLDRMGKSMGLRCNPKVWRTSFASYFIEFMPPSMVANMMGHSRVSTTLDHYTYHKNEKVHAEYDRVAQLQHA